MLRLHTALALCALRGFDAVFSANDQFLALIRAMAPGMGQAQTSSCSPQRVQCHTLPNPTLSTGMPRAT